ncbi:MAG: hypothetical protein FWD53_07230 [Phycisphaerales bacterium]|nr:hypothetical protein [Phycisphaerales bacterium]
MTLIDRLIKASPVLPVPIGDDTFHLRVMSGTERDEWEQIVADISDAQDTRSKVYAELLVRTLADETGNRQLTKNDVDTLQASVSAKILKQLFDKSLTLNRIGDEGIEAAKKSSAAAPIYDSGSSSPAASA